jgi:hypothetical protein
MHTLKMLFPTATERLIGAASAALVIPASHEDAECFHDGRTPAQERSHGA